MSVICTTRPEFCKGRLVSFAGGEGIVHGANWEFGRWTYLIEMALGIEPEFGRIGSEAMVLLHEAELYAK